MDFGAFTFLLHLDLSTALEINHRTWAPPTYPPRLRWLNLPPRYPVNLTHWVWLKEHHCPDLEWIEVGEDPKQSNFDPVREAGIRVTKRSHFLNRENSVHFLHSTRQNHCHPWPI